jgi:hypothetical protein
MALHSSKNLNTSFHLDKECPSKTFYFTLSDFTFHIHSIRFVLTDEDENWLQLISKTEIRLYIKYNFIQQDLHEQFEEISFPIHLFVDPKTTQPYFPINKLIDKQIFPRDIELDKIDQIAMKIVLIENQPIYLPYGVDFEINCK